MNTTSDSLKNVFQGRARLGESPCWHQQEQLLYWVDIYNHRVHQFNPVTGSHQFFDVGEVVGCIAPANNHRLIMAGRSRLAFLDTRNGTVTTILNIECNDPSTRFNDGKCDAAGLSCSRIHHSSDASNWQLNNCAKTLPNCALADETRKRRRL